jgi:hypothetical protein
MRNQLLLSLIITALSAGSSLATDVAPPTPAVVDQATSVLPASQQALRYAGQGMTMSACIGQVAALEKMLVDAGYGSKEVRQLPSGGVAIRWYHPGTDTTVIALVDLRASGSSIKVSALPYHDHWNEFRL